MQIEKLKESIYNGTLSDAAMIWEYKDNDFLYSQYLNEISKLKKLNIEYLDSLDKFKQVSIFGDSWNSDSLYVFKTKEYTDELELNNINHLIIITQKYSGKYDFTEFKKLEQWQIIDYVYSVCPGVDRKDLDWLMQLCEYNIYRLQQEIDKILLFPEVERKYLFKDFQESDVFSDLSDKTIYNFSNAIQSKNLNEIISVYKQIENCDIEPLGLVTILYNSYRKMIRVTMQKFATEENTGLKKNQIYAIKKSAEKYSGSQLLSILKLLSEIDLKLKKGMMPSDLILDYVVLNVISM